MKFAVQSAASLRAISARLAEASELLRVAAQACEATEPVKDDAGKVVPKGNERCAHTNASSAYALVTRADGVLAGVVAVLASEAWS